MKRILIDARESGTTSGRYVDKLVEHLHVLQPTYEIIVATKPHRVEFFRQLAPDFAVVAANFKEFTFAEQLGFWWFLKSQRADLVHFSMVQQPVLYRGLKITTMNDLTTLRFDNPSKNKLVFRFKQAVYRWLNKRVVKGSAHILTFTQYVKKDLQQFVRVNPKRITAVHLAADEIKEKSKPIKRLAGKQFIMYVGRPQPHKNLRRLIDAFATLKQQHPDLCLVLAGKTDELYEQHLAYVSANDIPDVLVTGFVSESELKWLYQNCSAYVFPSLSEGFGLPALEAMLHGAPVVSSNATCLPEICGDGACYFDPLDVDDMAASIHDVLVDIKLRSDLIKKGSVQVAKFSWHQTARQTLAVYDRVLKD